MSSQRVVSTTASSTLHRSVKFVEDSALPELQIILDHHSLATNDFRTDPANEQGHGSGGQIGYVYVAYFPNALFSLLKTP